MHMDPPRAAPETDYRLTITLLSALYFIFGFITCLNDILVPHLKVLFALTYARAALIQFSFFLAYFIMSVPSGRLVDRFGYPKSMAGGLFTAALGCCLFYPAAGLGSYPLFLFALFILASGITLLQVAANPYVSVLGAPETASSRLTLTQGFNSLGTTLAPLFGSLVILAATGQKLTAHPRPEPGAVQVPYLGLAVLLLGLATTTALVRLPMGAPHGKPGARGGMFSLLRAHPTLALGAIGIFTYVGAEVAIGSFLVNYLSQPATGGIPLATAARFVAFYWGGAMVGRFLGSAVMRVVPPRQVLVFNALAAMILVVTSITTGGLVSMWTILAVGFFNSIMFPTIFTLAIQGLGDKMGQASGILCMAIVGGAVMPVLEGLAADAFGLRTAFLLPVACYGYIAFYGGRGSVMRKGTPAG